MAPLRARAHVGITSLPGRRRRRRRRCILSCIYAFYKSLTHTYTHTKLRRCVYAYDTSL